MTQILSGAWAGKTGKTGATGPTGPPGVSGVDNLYEMNDVTVTGATGGDVLSYSGGNWINLPLTIGMFDFSNVPVGATAVSAGQLYRDSGDDVLKLKS